MYSLYLQNPDKFEYSVNGSEPTGPYSGYGIAIGNHLKVKPYWPVLLVASMVITLIWYGNPGISITSSLVFLIGFIGCLATFSQEKKRKNQELANSLEYLQAVAMARQQAASQQAQNELRVRQEQERLDAQHAAEIEHYNRVVLPAFEQRLEECRQEYAEMRIAYEQDKAEWESKRDSAVALLEKDIASNEGALTELYDSTGLISLHYREIPILEWLYDDMRTSDHDIRYATELLDRDRQRIATAEAGARVTDAIDRMQEEMRRDIDEVKMLQGVQVQSLQNLEGISEEILYTTEDIYASSKKVLFHQRINTVDIALREWRYHKAKKAAKESPRRP